jgi:lipoprotein signal peptidase
VTKPTLLLTAVAGLLAAIVAVSWFPASPLLAAVFGYGAVVGSLAHGVGAPVLRTIGATVIVLAATLALLLRAARHVIDVALWILTAGAGAALYTAKATA